MDEVELERVGHSCSDQSSENFCAMLRREYRDWYGNGTGGGLAPCCECQFCAFVLSILTSLGGLPEVKKEPSLTEPPDDPEDTLPE